MGTPKVPGRTTPGFAFSMVERALQDCLGTRQFGKEEIQQALKFFGNPPECVYCGSKDVKRWDHIIPVIKGGETVLGNMVPACSSCDDSKQALSFQEWLISDGVLSPKRQGIKNMKQRAERIENYMQHFAYHPRTLEERLNENQLLLLEKIRSRLKQIRKDMDLLVEDYRVKNQYEQRKG